MPEKNYSVNMLIALFSDFKEDGFRTLSENEVQKALQALSGPTPYPPDAAPRFAWPCTCSVEDDDPKCPAGPHTPRR